MSLSAAIEGSSHFTVRTSQFALHSSHFTVRTSQFALRTSHSNSLRNPSQSSPVPILEELETPTPIVDLDRLERNLDRMANYAKQHDLALRPHIKTHKSPMLAAEQLRRGAIGLTCATSAEVEVMSAVGKDILMAYPAIGRTKLKRLMNVSSETRLTVALDSAEAIEQIAAAAAEHDRPVSILVEIDLGMHRVGVPSAERAIDLVRLVRARPPLEYAGITFYPGHIRQPVGGQDESLAELSTALGNVLAEFEQAKLRPRIVSGGSTPTAHRTHEIGGVTEFRPGTYIFNDRTTYEIGACQQEDVALTVLATVISTAVAGQAVIDAGSKALGREPLRAQGGGGFGVLAEHPEVIVKSMSEEHGILELNGSDWRPAVGDRVRVIPNHVCIVVHLNDVVHGVRDGVVETSWPVAARGR
ncbi:MAG: alanine racemase [Anaerolineae bacterium]|nr:alanine racemase [Gemmatimonadaceae bacterium]